MKTPPARLEFIVLIAMMTSLVALSTDIMLPALGIMATELGRSDPADGHLVISTLFAGFAVGQLVVGPVSDAVGRRLVIHIGYGVFLAGCALAIFASTFEMLLLGRLLQGFAIAGPRIAAMAIVRDGFEGRAMARILSIVMAVFILVPTVAPALGQVVIHLSDWRGTFVFLTGMAMVTWVWFALRQPETLPPERRRPLKASLLRRGVATVFTTPAALGYTLCAGVIFGPFMAYLSLAQQVFQIGYDTGEAFVLWFGAAALSIGLASILNSALVERWGMRFLSNLALIGVLIGAVLFGAITLAWNGMPPFALFIGWLVWTFFGMGLIFGNFNALAMEPLGHMAGLGAAVVGAVATAVAIPIGTAISLSYGGGVTVLVAGFGAAALVCLMIGYTVDRVRPPVPTPS